MVLFSLEIKIRSGGKDSSKTLSPSAIWMSLSTGCGTVTTIDPATLRTLTISLAINIH